jgi:alpha-methylacyl-CoA racemase
VTREAQSEVTREAQSEVTQQVQSEVTQQVRSEVTERGRGALEGVRVLELAGVGPAPFAAMQLADHGADVLRIVRLSNGRVGAHAVEGVGELLDRGKRSLALDLKDADALALVLDLVESADVLIEGFRPGVAERLGVGPDVCLARNPRVVYGRMTGWGQEGPRAAAAGHDIDYLAVAGALFHLGRSGAPPTPPLNLVADFGGGGMFLAFGVLLALFDAQRTGRGQVVDAAIVDGVASLLTMFFGMDPLHPRGANLLDSGAPFYDAYECADGNWLAIGALEPQFFAALLEGLGIDGEGWTQDRRDWPGLRDRVEPIIRTRTRDEWLARFAARDACVAPVWSMYDARHDPHLAARSTFVEIDGATQPAPAPRLSSHDLRIRPAAACAGLGPWPVDGARLDALVGRDAARL